MAYYDSYEEHRVFVPPKLLPTLPPRAAASPPFSLRNRMLQVIWKIGQIRLTPEQPKYPGGSWHTEGMRDEAIVATAIYYAESENVTASHLAFREQVEEPDYEQYDDQGVKLMFNLEDRRSLNQPLGSCATLPKRMLAWPNTLQHCVQPFELTDREKPGHRSIVVAFLVDPYLRIPSTTSVPPQQREWLVMELRAMSRFWRLPQDCFACIVKHLEGGMSFEQAVERRERLMMERKFFVQGSNEQWFERPFSLCEH